jgi:hypothetical protein
MLRASKSKPSSFEVCIASAVRYGSLFLVVSSLYGFCFAQVSELQGSWKADFKDSLGAGTANLTLNAADAQNISGIYRTDIGGNGTIAIKQEGDGFKFIVTQTTQNCTGSFVGEFRLVQGKLSGSYSGTDCKGWHERGVISIIRADVSHSSSVAANESGYVKCGGFDYVIVWQVPESNNIVAKLRCNEPVAILAAPSQGYVRIQTQSNNSGYVAQNLVIKGSAPSTTANQVPTYATSSTYSYSGSSEYPFTIRVLQTDQVPYTVQTGGGQISTSCAINGMTMNCNSYQTAPMDWRHVLNAMLVVGSNGNEYIIACDAAWRWSKCRGLVIGDTFPAKMTSKGFAVQYYANGTPKVATYAILQAKVREQ